MLAGSTVLIVTPDRLVGIGLRSVLETNFAPAAIHVQTDLDPARLDRYGYVFLSTEAHLRYHEVLASVKMPVIVLTRETHEHDDHGSLLILCTAHDESRIIEDLERMQRRRRSTPGPRVAALTSREIAVLKLVAKGRINKEIADALSISLHTVISHRKNIAAKTGIKTIAGLTMYAVLNGLVSSRDIG